MIWRKDKLELEVRALQASASARWAYSQMVAIDSEGVIREKMLRNSNKVVGHQNIIKNLLGHQVITLTGLLKIAYSRKVENTTPKI